MAALCPHCGGELDSDVILCPFCRNPVDDEPQEPAPAAPPRGGSGALLKLLIGLALLGGTLLAHKKGAFRKAAPAAPAPRASERPEPPSHLLVRGKVYDLMTLDPVVGARILFREKGSGRVARSAATGTDGRYAARLSRRRGAGWDVSVSHPRYGDRYLEDGSLPYASMPRKGRAAARDLLYSSASLLHAPLIPAPGAEKIELDLVMSLP